MYLLTFIILPTILSHLCSYRVLRNWKQVYAGWVISFKLLLVVFSLLVFVLLQSGNGKS